MSLKPMLSFFCIFIYALIGWSQRPVLQHAGRYELCRDTRSNIGSAEIRKLKRTERFPMAWYTLDKFIDKIEDYKVWQQGQHVSCSRFDGIYSEVNPPTRAETILSDFSKRVDSLIQGDLQEQRELVQKSFKCVQGWLVSQKSQSVTFPQSTEPVARGCEVVFKKLVPNLKRRLSLGRRYLALSQPPLQAGRALPLIRPGLIATYNQIFFPSQKKLQGLQSMAPLDKEEFRRAADLGLTLTPAEAQKRFDTVISTSPILLLFEDQITPKSLLKALEILQDQTRINQVQMRQETSQDIMLMTGYVQRALEETPPEDRGDTCLIINEVINNIVGKEIIKERVLQVGAALSFSAAFFGSAAVLEASAGTAFKVAESLGAAAGVGYSALAISDEMKNYADAITRCSSTAASAGEDEPELKSLCDFQYADSAFNKGLGQVGQVLLGATLLGGIKVGVAIRNRPPSERSD